MSEQPSTVIYHHTDHPEWGRGIVLPFDAGRPKLLDLAFESGGRKTILKAASDRLKPVPMPGDEAKMLADKLVARRHAATGPIKLNTKKSKAATPAMTFTTFEAQAQFFEATFPGGFRGEKFVKDERGLEGAKRRKTDKGPAIAEAQANLGAEAFKTKTSEELFKAVTDLVRNTSLVHPLEGATSLDAMKPEHREAFIAALRDLLHGDGDLSDRFDAFIAAVRITEATGAVKRPSWPLVTIFGALVHPTEQVCVKPTFFQKQAALVRANVEYQPTPKASIYLQFLDLAKRTESSLRKAGHDPRDLVDVTSFICLTQGAKPAVAGKA